MNCVLCMCVKSRTTKSLLTLKALMASARLSIGFPNVLHAGDDAFA
jgi:hypothetical protein